MTAWSSVAQNVSGSYLAQKEENDAQAHLCCWHQNAETEVMYNEKFSYYTQHCRMWKWK